MRATSFAGLGDERAYESLLLATPDRRPRVEGDEHVSAIPVRTVGGDHAVKCRAWSQGHLDRPAASSVRLAAWWRLGSRDRA